jgi:hypothetical protein
MDKSIDEIIARMRAIRDAVEKDKTKARDYFFEYRDLQEQLHKLDRLNSECNIGIHGLPYFAGFRG